MDQIRCFGIDVDDDVFDYLCKSNRLLFILDGFDEIPSKARLQAARQLEFIARTYKNLRMIVSSRPEAGLGGSVYFHTFTIEPLSLGLQEGFLDHLFKGRQESAPVVNIVRTNEFIAGVTRTPLLLTLFAITYKASHFKPESVSEFYSIIFPTMLYRHDRMKIGFERERKSGLSDYLMQRVFEAFSFISMKHGNGRFNSSTFKAHLDTSLKYERTKPNIDHLIEDITLITGLIVRDGYDAYSYVHKSIQEYFATTFLTRVPDTSKRDFLGPW
jgi:hypothetical protein